MVERKISFQIMANIILIILAILCLLPFILLIVSSFTDELTLTHYGYRFFPKKLSLDAYRYLLVDSTTIIKSYIISFGVTIVGTLANVFLTVLFAYPLSRKDLPGRQIFSFFIFFTMLFNGGLVPSYIMWTQVFHIKNTWWAYIIPGLMMSAFYVIMMRTYFTTNIPEAVIEAARMDGATERHILTSIVLPMSIPIVATVTLLVGLSYWNDWINGLYYINKDTMYSIQSLLNKMLMDVQFLLSNAQSGASINQDIVLPSTGIKMAIAVMGAVPILMIYPFFQKYFIKGIIIGAVKG
ncbi:carbohydrate ABC transporter permease [Anaerocolumna chitinilytica]|uniref:ABC transporter permease n=1 Tax=Anaerocolumna chitinilytica TaxID=1727145 RepID=A0A7I8DKE8_9FIRM|nr:carbohydrate ABC transporter permease [Anaerocolumna chitinilytica]BCJ98948.1 ABC transporter permease [Anaerocolumna chitinilytica]